PGFPDDMPFFTRGLARVGARVLGLGDQPVQALPEEVRHGLTDYLQVGSLWDERAVEDEVRRWLGGRRVDRVECLWEPGMGLAARLRRALSVPGLTAEQTVAFRDKQRMKEVLDAAGIRTPHHYRARTAAEVRDAIARIGFPAIVKPIAGAGAADTHRVDRAEDVERALHAVRHVPEVSVEEYIDGEEFTYDTVCANGEVLFENVAWYRPKPLVARLNPWISAQAVVLRDLARPEIAAGVDLGRRVLRALGFQTGMTHMEWYRKPDGEVVFGEIGGRAPGGRLTHAMNYSCDADLFVGWAEAVCHGRLSQDTRKKYNAALVFKRAEGEGRIQRIDGLASLMQRYGEHVAALDLLPLGAPRRDYRQVVTGDGWICVRHPDLATTMAMADAFATELRMHAG
ncbi:MAG TPA: ATP-grasp domain-containing protein, partial [Planctomycetota bacterium]|nr:ATP-grasp domain-containing protein [Planctomycetota bacterium]